MIKRTFPPGDIREVHGLNWCENRSHKVIAMWAREAGRKPWSWASLPGLGTPDGWVHARTPAEGVWTIPPLAPMPRLQWLISERRPEPRKP